MKKQLAAIAAIAAAFSTPANAIDLGDLSISTTFGYESEYVFRGLKLTDHAFQGSVEANLDGFYVGIWTSQPISGRNGGGSSGPFEYENEIDFYFGYSFEINETFSGDVGFTYYWYPEAGPSFGAGDVDRSREFKLGVTADVILSPSLYFYYDFDLEQTVFELSGGYSYDLSDMVSNSTLKLGGWLGVVDAGDLGAGQIGGPDVENGYTYWGLSADVVYSFTENASASIGVRYSGNNDDITSGPSAHDDNFWWGTSFTAGF